MKIEIRLDEKQLLEIFSHADKCIYGQSLLAFLARNIDKEDLINRLWQDAVKFFTPFGIAEDNYDFYRWLTEEYIENYLNRDIHEVASFHH